jgi:hypothetical protein
MSGIIKTQANTMSVSVSTAVSSGVQTRNRTACGLETPAALTNTTIFFEESRDGVTWRPLMDEGSATQYSVPCSTSQARTIPLKISVMRTAEWVRLSFSGNELAARTFVLRTKIVD